MAAILVNLLILLIVVAVILGLIRLAQQAGVLPGWFGQAAYLVVGAIFLIALIYMLVPLIHSVPGP